MERTLRTILPVCSTFLCRKVVRHVIGIVDHVPCFGPTRASPGHFGAGTFAAN